MAFEPIENYGVIGNMQSVALVSMNGSIDFLCYPDFDSPTIFAALLDDQKGGRFAIRPQLSKMRVRQLYLPETNILLTRFLAEEGVAELTDFMPIDPKGGQPERNRPHGLCDPRQRRFEMSCQPRFNYAAGKHQVQISDNCATFSPDDSPCPPMSLYSNVPLKQESQDVTAEFSLKAGETASFALGPARAEGQQPEMGFVGERFLETAQFWKSWIAKSRYKGRWREVVHRSALLLKLLISSKHGSLIAAPTFSLPETIGGVRNWDYRFTWIEMQLLRFTRLSDWVSSMRHKHSSTG